MGKAGDKKTEIIGDYAATLSLIEVALGSFLHAFRIPFAGTFLSLNQGYLLCRATLSCRDLDQPKLVPYSISNVAAALKSLAPAGKKLGPMLSLSMQGLLFSLGPWIFGARLIGLCVGMVLLSLWAFLQPLVTYYLFFGRQLFDAVAYLFEKTLPYLGLEMRQLAWVLAGVIAVKSAAALALAALAWRTQGRAGFQDRLVAFAREKGIRPLEGKATAPQASNFLLAFRDLLRPLFLLSLATTGVVLYFSQGEGANIAWLLLRPIAIGFLFFYFSRTLTLDRWLLRTRGGRFEGFGLACQAALERIRRV
jgi:hypothetical protein